MIEWEGPFWVVWHGHYKWAYAGTLCRAYEYQQLIGRAAIGKHSAEQTA